MRGRRRHPRRAPPRSRPPRDRSAARSTATCRARPPSRVPRYGAQGRPPAREPGVELARGSAPRFAAKRRVPRDAAGRASRRWRAVIGRAFSGIEPVVRVAEGVHVGRRRSARSRGVSASSSVTRAREVEVARARRRGRRRSARAQPRLVVEPDAHERGRRPSAARAAAGWTSHGVGIVARIGEALDARHGRRPRRARGLEVRRWWRRREGSPPPAAQQRRARRLLLGEDGLRHHAVHALADVDDLGDPAVAHHRRQRVRLVAAHRHHLLRRPGSSPSRASRSSSPRSGPRRSPS